MGVLLTTFVFYKYCINMILFISTGGTIDKLYPRTVSGYNFEFGPPAVSNIISRIKPKLSQDAIIVPACAVDSQDMTDKNREELWKIIIDKKVDKVIITHGTDTMIETSLFLSRKMKAEENQLKIILTGAFLPESFKNSDADFNIGVAIGGISFCNPGVYVAMNGNIVRCDEASRTEEGTFI